MNINYEWQQNKAQYRQITHLGPQVCVMFALWVFNVC